MRQALPARRSTVVGSLALAGAFALGAGLAVPHTACADDPEPPEAGTPAPDDGSALAREGFELYRQDNYTAARPKLEEALKKDPDSTNIRQALAMIAYFYGEDTVARAHLEKLREKGAPDEKLETILDTPFKKIYGDATILLQGPSDKTLDPALPKRGHYVVATDYGFDKSRWDAVKGDFAKLQQTIANAKKPNKAAEKQLEALTRANRAAGVVEAAKILEDIHDQYSQIIKFEKDPKLVSRVFIFKERGDYLDFYRYLCGKDGSDTGGVCVGQWAICLVSGNDTGRKYGVLWQQTRSTLFHEAFHQFLNYWMHAPSWINEGLAEVFGDADIDPQSGRVVIGRLQKTPIGAAGMTNFQQVYGALKPTALFPVYSIREFITLSQSRYYAEDEKTEADHKTRMGQNYAQGWGVCFFLVMGYKGGRTIILDYLKALRDKKSNDEAISIAFKNFKTDADWEKLDKDFRKYMQQLANMPDPK